MRLAAFLLLVSCCSASFAQHAPTGAVTGTVSCADTNLPARLAEVALQPVRDPDAPRPARAESAVPSIQIFQTRLDGSFVIPAVPPGRYYVVARKPGYLSPASRFTVAEIEHPDTPELKAEIAREVPIATVAAGKVSTLDIRLQRGASVSGSVRFDDGSPASAVAVSFERKNKQGAWIDVSNVSSTTDDLGHFRASGLPAGEYRMQTELEVRVMQVGALFSGERGGMLFNSKSSLAVFYGDTFFRKDAKTIPLDPGQEVAADISIPSSKLHSVAGTLVNARTGRVVNAGKVEVLEPGEKEPLTSVKVDADDPGFRLEYVPEGTLAVSVTDAREITREPIPYPAGSFGTPRYKEAVLQRFGDYHAPLLVTTDVTGLNLPVPPLDGQGGTKSAPSGNTP